MFVSGGRGGKKSKVFRGHHGTADLKSNIQVSELVGTSFAVI